jgi:putative ABC transport system permease protein
MLTENIRIAFSGLIANKLRTLLSVLGILIGVMSVTLLLAVGAGASRFVKGQVSSLGTNTQYVFLRDPATLDATATRIRKPALTRTDLAILSEPGRIPSVSRAVPEITSTVTVSSGRVTRSVLVNGTRPIWTQISNRTLSKGLMFNDDDLQARRRVAVIGATVERRLYAGQSAVGSTLRIGSANYDIIGVLQRRGGGIVGDLDNVVLIPETAMIDTVTGSFESYSQIIAQARPDSAKSAKEQIEQALLAERKITDLAKADFEVFDNAQLTQTASTISTVFSALLGLIAGISLLVGGIGVMNIMLVTVTERTREIGIRKALGAKRWHLLTQFLVESVVLTGVGGVIGAGIGSALSLIRVGNFSPVLQPWMLVLAVGVSALIGVGFGVYPANKAAKLRPIDALRFE